MMYDDACFRFRRKIKQSSDENSSSGLLIMFMIKAMIYVLYIPNLNKKHQIIVLEICVIRENYDIRHHDQIQVIGAFAIIPNLKNFDEEI
ncbi:hypothetical protein L2E82_32224 [Cichorium intybus]|uniref:Uncharacterized protein n=1 Tax=Cichorium intybus TaxID=13427 RepID=A0ACB9BI12_CICIN|nr:hypothetical protein L2E82_32224 [Cichorium intybus]